MHKILPIWRPEDHAKFPSSIENLIGAQIAPSGTSQKPVKLIDGQHGGRRIIDRLGERLDRDIDQNAKRKEGILLHRALGATGPWQLRSTFWAISSPRDKTRRVVSRSGVRGGYNPRSKKSTRPLSFV